MVLAFLIDRQGSITKRLLSDSRSLNPDPTGLDPIRQLSSAYRRRSVRQRSDPVPAITKTPGHRKAPSRAISTSPTRMSEPPILSAKIFRIQSVTRRTVTPAAPTQLRVTSRTRRAGLFLKFTDSLVEVLLGSGRVCAHTLDRATTNTRQLACFIRQYIFCFGSAQIYCKVKRQRIDLVLEFSVRPACGAVDALSWNDEPENRNLLEQWSLRLLLSWINSPFPQGC